MQHGEFLPDDVVDWMNALPYFYEDEHAIYVHAGLVEKDGKWLHPSATENLPPELSSFTPEDPLDMWVGENVVVIDTGCGKGGFLTVLELPAMKVYESR